MLFVTFKAAGARFAVPAREVEEVAPLVQLSQLPGAPPVVAGLMNYRGRSLPVADASLLLSGKASRHWASTRILVARVPDGTGGSLVIGLLAERLLKTLDIPAGDVADPAAPAAAFVRGVAAVDGELVQVLDLNRMLPPELLERLRDAREPA
ncbi:MAG: chemotaxis protein CheW [Acidobacteriota bacterium]